MPRYNYMNRYYEEETWITIDNKTESIRVRICKKEKEHGHRASDTVVRSKPLGLRILSTLSLHKRRIEVSLHAISTASTAPSGHHSHTYTKKKIHERAP